MAQKITGGRSDGKADGSIHRDIWTSPEWINRQAIMVAKPYRSQLSDDDFDDLIADLRCKALTLIAQAKIYSASGLRVSLIRAAIDMKRSKVRTTRWGQPLVLEEETTGETPDIVMDFDTRDAILRVISGIQNEDVQVAIALRLEGCSTCDICELTGIKWPDIAMQFAELLQSEGGLLGDAAARYLAEHQKGQQRLF